MSGEGTGDAVTESQGEEDVEQSAAELTLQQQLQRALAGQVGRSQLSKAVKKELQNLPVSGKGPFTTMAYKWLKGIVATSVESERVFSTVGNIVTKVRSRLNDDTVDALCSLKWHYR